MSYRILFLGENWYGSCARACAYALRRLGHDVIDLDAQRIVPTLQRPLSRALLRVAKPWLLGEYNDSLVRLAETFEPDLLVAFKGTYVRGASLQRLRRLGVRLYNYYPDTSAFGHGSLIPESLAEYDCVFYTKPFFEQDVRSHIALRHGEYLPHGYDSEIHRPVALSARDRERFTHDVVVIANQTAAKERMLLELVSRWPDLDLAIWGYRWEGCAPALRPYLRGTGIEGDLYTKAICGARINLALLGGIVSGASQGDETTTRTFEIPACRGFMLHPRTPEVLRLFDEGREIACFGSVEELIASIRHYLERPDDRERLADAAFGRCVPSYSYGARMRELIGWHDRELRRRVERRVAAG